MEGRWMGKAEEGRTRGIGRELRTGASGELCVILLHDPESRIRTRKGAEFTFLPNYRGV